MGLKIYIGENFVLKDDFNNLDNWEVGNDPNNRVSNVGGKICFDSPEGQTEYVSYKSKFALDGEFDMEISFYITSLTRGVGNTDSYIKFGYAETDHAASTSPYTYISRAVHWYYGDGDGYWARTQTGPSDKWSDDDAASGIFRLKRVNGGPTTYDVTFWYYKDGIWQWEGSADGLTWNDPKSGNNPVNVYLRIDNEGGNVDACFDRFRVTEGTVTWP